MIKAIEDDPRTLNAIAIDAGVSYSIIYRFAHGQRGITLDAAERLADTLGLELRPKKQNRKR